MTTSTVSWSRRSARPTRPTPSPSTSPSGSSGSSSSTASESERATKLEELLLMDRDDPRIDYASGHGY